MTKATAIKGNGKALLWLKAFRKFHGFTQSELAAKIGKNQGHYQKIETGAIQFKVQEALTLCETLGLTLQNLLRTDFPGAGYFTKPVCTSCGGDNVKQDPYSAWDAVNQTWEHCNPTCEDCWGETSLEWITLDIHPDAPNPGKKPGRPSKDSANE